MTRKVVIAGACRTAIGKMGGGLSSVPVAELGSIVIKESNINCVIGKASFEAKALEENFNALYNTILKARPASVKGNFITNVVISSNMGPGIKVVF